MEAARSIIPHSEFDQLREAKAILSHEGEALMRLARQLDSSFLDAVDQVVACTGTIIVTGVGKAGLIGRKVSATLASTGSRSFFIHPTEALHGDLGSIASNDLVVIFSNSGETAEIVQLLPSLESRHLPVIAVTASELSTLGSRATVTIAIGHVHEAGLNGLAPTTSTTAMLGIGDALAMVASQRREFTASHFAQLHPGGNLGKRLTRVVDVMRCVEDVRISDELETVREVYTKHGCPGRRSGAVMLVNDLGLLTGIFTDSDLARLLERRRDEAFDRPIREVMTIHPKTIQADALVEEAIELLSERHLSELPVIDDTMTPIGLIDITDLIGFIPTDR